MPSVCPSLAKKWACGIMWSARHKKPAPPTKPIAATSHAGMGALCAISMAGSKSDQKEAATIMPAAKPSIIFSTRLFISLKKKTMPAPSAVINQVKQVEASAKSTGSFIFVKNSIGHLSCLTLIISQKIIFTIYFTKKSLFYFPGNRKTPLILEALFLLYGEMDLT